MCVGACHTAKQANLLHTLIEISKIGTHNLLRNFRQKAHHTQHQVQPWDDKQEPGKDAETSKQAPASLASVTRCLTARHQHVEHGHLLSGGCGKGFERSNGFQTDSGCSFRYGIGAWNVVNAAEKVTWMCIVEHENTASTCQAGPCNVPRQPSSRRSHMGHHAIWGLLIDACSVLTYYMRCVTANQPMAT